jgi:hypothetical protein
MRPQAQQEIHTSPRALFVPGQWPLECASESAPLACDTAVRAEGTFLSTVGAWASTVSLANIVALPIRLAQRFFRRQQIYVQPIVREDGARKKRIIDAGPADATKYPTTSPSMRARLGRRFLDARVAPSSPSIWSPSPSPVKTNGRLLNHLPAHLDNQLAGLQASTDQSPTPIRVWSPDIWSPNPNPGSQTEPSQYVYEDLDAGEDDDENLDDSIEFSFSHALTSDTPPRPSSATNSPITRFTDSAAPAQGHLPFERLSAPRFSPIVRQQIQAVNKISPNTHRTIIKRAGVTPIRKTLLRLQIGTHGGLNVTTSPTVNHTNPSTPLEIREQSELQQKLFQASVLKDQATAVAQRAQEASENYRLRTEARQNSATDVPTEEDSFNHVETVDVELSFLSDAPDYEEEPQTPLRKSVRWNTQAGVQPFFCDEEIADAMDSTIESIIFSPVRPSLAEELSSAETSDDESQDGSNLSPSRTPVETAGFTGVPDPTWDSWEDSLEESQISLELLNDLHEQMQAKLALERPATPTPPPVKALVSPLEPEEQDLLNAAVKKTDNGKDSTAWVVDDKLYARDFGTLLPRKFNGDVRAWLNDNIVNEYLNILTDGVKANEGFAHKRGGGAPPVHAFSSFWYPTLMDRPKGVERWAARFQLKGAQYLDANLILYPICDAGHWRLLAVKPKERTIEYLDSLGWDGGKYVNALKDYLAKELGSAWVESEWTVEQDQRSTRQVNGSDCGVFTILNSLALLRGDEFQKVLACDGMSAARERIAITLMKGTPTTELE